MNGDQLVRMLVNGLINQTKTISAAGSTQANATQITSVICCVSGADATKGVRLPVPTAGQPVVVINKDNAVLKVYPHTGGQINAGGANTALSVAAYGAAVYFAESGTLWRTVPKLPS